MARQIDLSYAREFAPGLIEVLALDLGELVRVLRREMLGASDLDEAFRIGRANLQYEADGATLFTEEGITIFASDSMFGPSRLLDPLFDAALAVEAPRGIAFSIPDQQLLEYHAITGEQSIGVVQKLVESAVRSSREDRPGGLLSSEVFYRSPDGFVQQITHTDPVSGTVKLLTEGPFLDALNG